MFTHSQLDKREIASKVFSRFQPLLLGHSECGEVATNEQDRMRALNSGGGCY
jgi:hypothetical protein